jgi:hypothetical protein
MTLMGGAQVGVETVVGEEVLGVLLTLTMVLKGPNWAEVDGPGLPATERTCTPWWKDRERGEVRGVEVHMGGGVLPTPQLPANTCTAPAPPLVRLRLAGRGRRGGHSGSGM